MSNLNPARGPSPKLAHLVQRAVERFAARVAEQMNTPLLDLLRPLPVVREHLWPLRGWVRLENLGGSKPFKIVKLMDGRRVIVDQDVKVEDPLDLRLRWRGLDPVLVRDVCYAIHVTEAL